MDALNRRQFLAAASAMLAACDNVVVEFSGDDGIQVDADGERFIPPITPNSSFYVYQVFPQPNVDPDTWFCRIADRGSELGRIDKEFLDRLQPREVELTLQCIGGTVVGRRIDNAVWYGLPLSEVLEAAGITGPPPGTEEIVLRGADEYHASVPVSDYDSAPIWVIWGMNGEPLPYDHGAPCRLLIPGRYGVKNLKWITEIEWLDQRHENFWDPQGWSHTAEHQVCGFIHYPAWDQEVETPVEVLGSAFAGRDPIARVEMTSDGGRTWSDCTIEYQVGRDVWTLWSWKFKAKKAGDYEIQVRVTTESGQVSSMNPAGDNNLNGYNGGQLLPLVVV